MRKYSFIQALYLSFYSKDFYRDVNQYWGSRVFLYLLFILALSWLPTTFNLVAFFKVEVPGFLERTLSQLPAMQIKNGVLITPAKHPYFIKRNHDTFAIIDTTGQFKNLDGVDANMLLTQHDIFYKNRDAEVKQVSFDKKANYRIQPQAIKTTIMKIVEWSWLVIFPLCLVVSYLFRLIQSLFYALLAKFGSLVSSQPFAYADIYRLNLVSLTPVLVLSAILDTFHVTFPYFRLVSFAIAMGYLCFAVSANKLTPRSFNS